MSTSTTRRPSFTTTHSSDINFNKLKDATEQLHKFVTSNPLSEGRFVSEVVMMANQDNIISHGLGRVYSGFLMVRNNNFVSLKESETANDKKDRFINLVSDGDAVVTLYIF